MRIVRAAAHRRMAWKNGRGSTTEVAVFPPEAGIDTFGWRISMARVDGNGPFSRFEGIDRSLSVLNGAGLVLQVGERPAVTLTQDSAPASFPGDAQTHATLLAGPVADLNVMTRRGEFSHSVTRFDGSAAKRLRPAAETTLILSRGPGLVLTGDDGPECLETDDVAFLTRAAEITPNGAPFFLIQIFRP